MSRRPAEIGERHGALTLEHLADSAAGLRPVPVWRCDCGRTRCAAVGNIRAARNPSCLHQECVHAAAARVDALERQLHEKRAAPIPSVQSRFISLGERTGHLVVEALCVESKGKGRDLRQLHLWRCDCGGTRLLGTGDGRSGAYTDCNGSRCPHAKTRKAETFARRSRAQRTRARHNAQGAAGATRTPSAPLPALVAEWQHAERLRGITRRVLAELARRAELPPEGLPGLRWSAAQGRDVAAVLTITERQAVDAVEWLSREGFVVLPDDAPLLLLNYRPSPGASRAA